jgi:hypothetical protein
MKCFLSVLILLCTIVLSHITWALIIFFRFEFDGILVVLCSEMGLI